PMGNCRPDLSGRQCVGLAILETLATPLAGVDGGVRGAAATRSSVGAGGRASSTWHGIWPTGRQDPRRVARFRLGHSLDPDDYGWRARGAELVEPVLRHGGAGGLEPGRSK